MIQPANWPEVEYYVARALECDDAAAAAQVYLAQLFGKPEEKDATSVTTSALTAALLRAALGSTSSVEAGCEDEGISQRSLWRYFPQTSLNDLDRYWLRVYSSLFYLARNRFGLFAKGFDVLIDEHQTLVFGRTRKTSIDDDGVEVWHLEAEDLTEVGQLAGASKKDKYSGAYRSLEYQVMVARCRQSKVILPLDVVLVATGGPLMVEGLRVQSRSKEDAIARFINTLEALYPTPRIILFDRGYDANVNYATLYEYCFRHKCFYMTPARRLSGIIIDEHGTFDGPMKKYMGSRRSLAKPICPGSSTFFVVGRRPVVGHVSAVRMLITFYRPMEDELPYGSLPMDATHYAVAFYTNAPNPTPDIKKWNKAYKRWGIETWFKVRVKHFNNGRAHNAGRRLTVFMTGLLLMGTTGVVRYKRVPIFNAKVVSKRASTRRLLREAARHLDRRRAQR